MPLPIQHGTPLQHGAWGTALHPSPPCITAWYQPPGCSAHMTGPGPIKLPALVDTQDPTAMHTVSRRGAGALPSPPLSPLLPCCRPAGPDCPECKLSPAAASSQRPHCPHPGLPAAEGSAPQCHQAAAPAPTAAQARGHSRMGRGCSRRQQRQPPAAAAAAAPDWPLGAAWQWVLCAAGESEKQYAGASP